MAGEIQIHNVLFPAKKSKIEPQYKTLTFHYIGCLTGILGSWFMEQSPYEEVVFDPRKIPETTRGPLVIAQLENLWKEKFSKSFAIPFKVQVPDPKAEKRRNYAEKLKKNLPPRSLR